MANMTFKADLLPNSDYEYRLGSITTNPPKRWIIPGTTIETIIGTQTAQTGTWTGASQTIDALYDGLTIHYFLPYPGSGNATLNLTLKNGTTTGAINCYYNESRLSTHFGRGSVITLTYFSAGSISVGGTATTDARWIANANYDSNDIGYYTRKIYPNIKAGPNKIFPYTLIMERQDGRWESLVKQAGTGSDHTANTNGFLIGNVWAMWYNETYSENNNINAYRIWSAHSGLIDMRYSMNVTSAAGFTGYKPVYLVGTIGTNGLFYLDTTKWWAQDLPSTDDGKVYIYIGDAYDYYRITLSEVKPAYFYRDSRVQMYAPGRGIKGISRSGTTFTVTRDDGTTFTFNQQDNNTTSFTITANATDGIWDLTGTNGTNAVTYAVTPYSSQQNKASFDTSSTNPSRTDRLNYNGYLYATKLYSGGNEVLTAHQSLAGYLPLSGGTMTGAIKRYYSAASTDPVIAVAANNQDATALWMGHGTAAGNPSGNYYKFLYKGTGSSPNNYFQLIAGVNSSSEVIAIQVNEQGNVSFTNTVAADISGNAATATAVTQKNQIDPNDYRILLSGSANDTDATEGTNKSTNLRFNPSTKVFSVGGDINATGDLTIIGNTNLNSETYAESITAGSLLVNGAANFVNIPTAPTPEVTSNDTSIATTAFVKNNIGGLSGAMHFKGTTTTTMSDGLTTAAVTIGGSSYTPEAGDVVLYSDSEFVWTGSIWERFGRDSSFKTTQTAVTTATAETTTATTFVHSVTQDANGVITVKTRPLPTYNNYSLPTASTSTKGGIKVGSGLTMSSETLNHSNSVTAKTAYVDTATTARANGGTIKVTDVKYDAQGHITGTQDRTITLSQTTYSLSGLGGVGTVSASGTAPLTLSASKSGTTVTISGSVAAATTSAAGVWAMSGTNANTLISQLPTWTADPTDDTYLIRRDTGGTASYGQVKFSTVYNYIKTKLNVTNNNINLSRNTETTIATIGGTAIKIKLPASDNTDTKQNIVLATTTKAYLTGVTTAPTSTTAAMTGVGDTGVYLTSTAGELSAVRHSFNSAGSEKAYISYNTATNALDFVFT